MFTEKQFYITTVSAIPVKRVLQYNIHKKNLIEN